LDEGADDMDDASRENLRVLRLQGERMVHDQSPKLDRVVEALER
jgi:hypothetical protein